MIRFLKYVVQGFISIFTFGGVLNQVDKDFEEISQELNQDFDDVLHFERQQRSGSDE